MAMGDVPLEFPWPWGKLDGSSWMIRGILSCFPEKTCAKPQN